MPNYIRQFGSLTDWINYSEIDQLTDDSEQFNRSSISGSSNFTGTKDKAEAFKLFHTGYPEGLQKMKQVLDCVRNLIRLKSPQYEFAEAVDGSSPNIEAFLQGQPEDMFFLSPVELEAPPTVLTVQFEMAYAAQITTTQAIWAGATVFAAMEALRAQGCAVQPILTHTVTDRKSDYWQSTVAVPNSLDLDTLSFLFTHPSVLRRIVFSIMEHESQDIRQKFAFGRNYGGYSYPANLKNSNAEIQISIANICYHFRNDEASNIPIAQKMLQTLVDTKFQKFQ